MAELIVEVPEPHSAIQAQIMDFFITPGVQTLWVCAGTKFGKTLSAASAVAIAAPIKSGSRWRWVAPIYSQAKIGMRYMKKIWPKEPFVVPNESEPSLSFRDSDVHLGFCHGQDPESLEGDAIDGYVLDECSKMKEAVYSSCKTTTTVTKGPFLCISTGRGKNWFYKKCMMAREEMLRAAREGRTPRHIFLTAPTSANPFVDPAVIAEAQRQLPDRLFRQYYLAEFVDDGEVLTGFRNCINSEIEIDPVGSYQTWDKSDLSDLEVVIGADWAKISDWSVFTAWTLKGEMVAFRRFQGLGYVEAVKELVRFARKFKLVHMVQHDKTGVGEAIDDMLMETDLSVQGLTFTANSKSQLVNKFALALQQGKPSFPNWLEMIREFEVFEVSTNEIGQARYCAAEGFHDDIIFSMCLGWRAVLEYGESDEFTVKILEDLPKKKLTLEKWYSDIADDDF